ncbi:MAG TPA: serine/threonine-protein kinase [Longimicrobiales bacterium]|nr:serine/threonine-protein kinase [Longimicrobiales bacterium]
MHTEATGPDATVLAELQPDLEVLRPLGSGDTANVYLAREPALQRLVAVKVLRPDVAADAVARQRFEREAQSAARISHANVTAIYRVGRLTGDVPYMVMEYIDGRTVRDIVESGTTFDYGYARGLLAAVASALAAAHERGVVHRDVRPGNVFVENRTARAVLGDFGIAALLESGAASAARLTAVGVKLGDTRYMSPEQVRGEQVTEQSDVYAFGILAYEVLAGRGPYDAKGEAQMIAAHLQREPLKLRELRGDVDAAVAALIERCLAKDPNRRPRAQEIAGALTTAQAPSAAALPAEDAGPIAQLLEELRRRRVYKVLVGYGAFALAVFGVAQGIDQAFPLSPFANQVMVVATLGGFPVALILSWVFDIRAGRIQRTGGIDASSPARILMWLGLGASVLVMVALGWLLLGGG